MVLDFKKFDNAQLEVLNSYIDNKDVFIQLCSCVDHNYSPEQIEVIGKAINMGLDVTNILNSRLSLNCMLLLCDSIRNGIDVSGLDNANIDDLLLKEIIDIKMKSSFDMSFIRNLSLRQCQDFVIRFNKNPNFDISTYIEEVNCDRLKSCFEIEYALKGYSK